ncbi:MAG: gliding motility-associated C-terminal domain-containing protein [Saprospiraceae bacterium]|nr:gliding motility-associated C-terminal domain-containing protein [Saprospiraceae bacterium]
MRNRLLNTWFVLYLMTFRQMLCYCIIISVALLSSFKSFTQSIPCDGAYYIFLTSSINSTTSAMYRVTTSNATGLPEYQLINADLKHRVTAAGYSVWDERIYALDYNTYELLRIDADGVVEAFPVPLSLDTTLLFFAGELSPGGGNLYVIGRDKKNMRDKTLFSIRLYREDHLAGRVSVLSDFGAALEDLAFDPVRGTFYGYDVLNNKLAWVDNFSGKIVDYFSRNMEGVAKLGSLFFDRTGQLHAYGSSSGNEEKTFYHIDKLQGKAENIATGPPGRFSDGCACPYTVRAFKMATPKQILPCNELTVTYDVINHAGTAYSYISVNDTFPPGFIITKIVKTPQTSIIKSGVGSNILSVEGIDLILDTNRIIITLEITDEAQPGLYASQAVVQELPIALGVKIHSDDPITTTSIDPTAIELIGEQSKGQLTTQRLQCNGDGMMLEANINIANATYQWSTGATEASTLVQSPGWYAVTITSDCGRFVDSVLVNNFPEILQIELDSVRTIELGESINITPNFNANRSLTYEWQAADGSTIDCPSCATLSARPIQNTIYTLFIKDENGCQASDSIRIEVLPVREVFAPSAFSPNNDGVNDIFYLQGKGDAKVIYLRIFDRWGNQVFQIQNGRLNDQSQGWNGKTNGKIVPSQSFIYIAEIEFLDGTRKRLSGEISLIK